VRTLFAKVAAYDDGEFGEWVLHDCEKLEVEPLILSASYRRGRHKNSAVREKNFLVYGEQ